MQTISAVHSFYLVIAVFPAVQEKLDALLREVLCWNPVVSMGVSHPTAPAPVMAPQMLTVGATHRAATCEHQG